MTTANAKSSRSRRCIGILALVTVVGYGPVHYVAVQTIWFLSGIPQAFGLEQYDPRVIAVENAFTLILHFLPAAVALKSSENLRADLAYCLGTTRFSVVALAIAIFLGVLGLLVGFLFH